MNSRFSSGDFVSRRQGDNHHSSGLRQSLGQNVLQSSGPLQRLGNVLLRRRCPRSPLPRDECRQIGTPKDSSLKHSFSSSDIDMFDGNNNESAQRRKARLERHERIMERAAKALAEKKMRDLQAQKEQAERNRLAESLDVDVKRWANGKEGNLRALLSTLQYILGHNSGWQPISLTELITTAAVKKGFWKATPYVHPDKLQQRGASIQQKYACEKVFDLLKRKLYFLESGVNGVQRR